MKINAEMTNEQIVQVYQDAEDPEEKKEVLSLLCEKNIGLIRKAACIYSRFEGFDDLVQEGFFGIKAAADMYDPNQESVFSTYAFLLLRQTMRRYIETCGSLIRISANSHNGVYKLNKIIERYSVEFGREPTDRELCKLLGIDQDQLDHIRSAKGKLKLKSLDEPLAGDPTGSATLADTIQDKHNGIDDVIEIAYNEKLAFILWSEAHARLTPREEQVIIERYQNQSTLSQIGAETGLTAEGVRKLENRALLKLKKSENIRLYREDVISHAFRGGAYRFMITGTSSTEDAALRLYDERITEKIRELDRDLRRLEKKLGVKLDDNFRQMQINKLMGIDGGEDADGQ